MLSRPSVDRRHSRCLWNGNRHGQASVNLVNKQRSGKSKPENNTNLHGWHIQVLNVWARNAYQTGHLHVAREFLIWDQRLGNILAVSSEVPVDTCWWWLNLQSSSSTLKEGFFLRFVRCLRGLSSCLDVKPLAPFYLCWHHSKWFLCCSLYAFISCFSLAKIFFPPDHGALGPFAPEPVNLVESNCWNCSRFISVAVTNNTELESKKLEKTTQRRKRLIWLTIPSHSLWF